MTFWTEQAEQLPLRPAAKPPGHRFFADCERETYARMIEWSTGAGEPGGWFATLTFRDYVSMPRADRFETRWLGRVAQSLSDLGGTRLRWITATEWQRRMVVHYHLLVMGQGLDSLSRKRWESRWEHAGGGFCRVYDAAPKSAPYLAKYLNKDRGGDIEWGGAWQGLSAPASVQCCQAGRPHSSSAGVLSVDSPLR